MKIIPAVHKVKQSAIGGSLYVIDSSRNEQMCLYSISAGLHNNRCEMANERQSWLELSEQIKWLIMLLTPAWNSLLINLTIVLNITSSKAEILGFGVAFMSLIATLKTLCSATHLQFAASRKSEISVHLHTFRDEPLSFHTLSLKQQPLRFLKFLLKLQFSLLTPRWQTAKLIRLHSF